jgi:hypothetical protein
MSQTMKLWERAIEHRLRRMTSVTKNQFGFMLGRSTMEAIFFGTTTYRKVQGAEEGPAYRFH